MAIAKTYTLLSLDRYARIMGINPMHFNGGNQVDLASGSILFPLDNAQNNIWPQYSWQNFDQISREDLAQAIWTAERDIVNYLGYYPAPTWIEKERHDLNLHHRPDKRYANMAYDAGGNESSIRTDFGYFIKGGRRAVSLIASQTPITYWDLDADGWSEFGAITFPVPATVTDMSEIKVYFVGQVGNPIYELRDFKSKAMSGANMTIGFETWKLVDPELFEAYPTSDGTGGHIEMADTTNFVTALDVYREYNDDTQNHVEFHEQSSLDASDTMQGGFLYQDKVDGFVTPVQADYDAVNGTWTRQCSSCVYPTYADLWYYSGMRNHPGKHPYSGDYLPNDIAVAIAYMATARLERVFYANNNATALAASLMDQTNESERGGNFKMPTSDSLTNPFGTKKGELLAWRTISRFKTQRRAGGSL